MFSPRLKTVLIYYIIAHNVVISAVKLVIIEVLGQATLRPQPANGGSALGIQPPDSEERIISGLFNFQGISFP